MHTPRGIPRMHEYARRRRRAQAARDGQQDAWTAPRPKPYPGHDHPLGPVGYEWRGLFPAWVPPEVVETTVEQLRATADKLVAKVEAELDDDLRAIAARDYRVPTIRTREETIALARRELDREEARFAHAGWTPPGCICNGWDPARICPVHSVGGAP